MRIFRTPAIAVVAATFLLSACGTTEEPSTGSSSASGSTAEGPVSVTDARGEKLELDQPAEKVVGLEWSDLEMLVTLGVMPVGAADIKGYSSWVKAAPLDESVKDVGTRQEPSVDAIVALEPDLVIAHADRDQKLIEQLEEYVPVLVMQATDASDNIGQMKHNVETIATTVGEEDKAADVLADFDAKVAEGKDALAEAGVAGEQFAMADGWQDGSSIAIRMFGKGSLLSDIAVEMGLENGWTGKVDEWGLAQTDVEGLGTLGDVHFFYNANDSDVDVFGEGLAKNAIWTSKPFVKDGKLYEIDEGTWTFGGPLSCEQFIDFVVKTLTS
ncbi:MAG: ABC transporter substrate-binding protein [Nocardioidaceae bacterium]